MAETNISADKITGQVIQAEHVNELKNAIITTFSPRNSSGTLESGENLGSLNFEWGVLHIQSILENGNLVDFGSITTAPNIIKSGQIRGTSDLPDFIRADGATNSATIEAAATNLVVSINGLTATVTSDIVLSSLTVAGTGAATDCVINDASLVGQLESKYIGGEDDTLTVDTMGANIIAKIGEYICLNKAGSAEMMLVFVKSATELTNIRRGYFFDSAGNPIVRETLANDDILSLMSLGWVFLEDDAATTEVIYNAPIYDFVQPSSPSTGDYWFDLQNQQWRRFNGSVFVVINRTLIGLLVIDSTKCLGSRSLDFDLNYSDYNTVDFDVPPFSATIIRSKNNNDIISVNANTIDFRFSKVEFDITTDRDTGVSETANTRYYMYITQDGENIISDERPYKFNPKLRGFYHPYQSWRCVGSFFNNVLSDIRRVFTFSNKKTAQSIQKGNTLIKKQVIISNDSGDLDHDIKFQEGSWDFSDSSGQGFAGTLIKRLDASFACGTNAGGLADALTIQPDTTYHCFGLSDKDSSLGDYAFDADINAVNLLIDANAQDLGLTRFKRLGSIMTDSSSNILPFVQAKNYFYLKTEIENLATLGTTPTNVTTSCPKDLEFIALLNIFTQLTTAVVVTKHVRVYPLLFNDDAVTNSNSQASALRNAGNFESVGNSAVEVLTNSSGQVRARSNDGSANTTKITTRGWIDFQL